MLRILHFGPSQRFLRGPDRLSPSGPSPYTCPGVDRPFRINLRPVLD